ncbi:gluconate 5-dehydrogenase [Streptococcus pneumoniae]|nr:gluconate 5-dehydrogenase [Streptococcus pneumoniae]
MTNTSFSIEQFSLKGKIALITGASYGIGFAIAKSYAEAGATIVFNDINQDLVNKGIEAYREVGIEAHGYVCDVTDEDGIQAMVKQIEQGLVSLTSSLITLVLSAEFQCAK